jgi:energy-coupling factor transporter ATP-binding protein EcfA2
MFKSLRIAKFRGIKEGEVPDLRQVSLFVGPNNSGKSTILDALLLANSVYSHNDPLGRSSLQILAERHNLPPYEITKPWRALWYAYEPSNEIKIGVVLTHGVEVAYRMEVDKRGLLELNTPPQGRLVVAAEGFGEAPPGQSFSAIDRSRGHGSAGSTGLPPLERLSYDIVLTYLRDLVLVDSEFRRNTKVEQLLWPQLISNRRDKLLTQMLRDVYGMDVENLTYTPSMKGNELVILLPKYSVRVDDLGDGARYFVRMLMVLSLLKDTTLLLEEPETAHHCRAQADITRWIVRSAKERNLQVLATTHSLETVDHFLAACTDSSVEFGLHHTELKDGVLTCRSVDRSDARVLMDMGVDPRCAP